MRQSKRTDTSTGERVTSRQAHDDERLIRILRNGTRVAAAIAWADHTVPVNDNP